MTAKSYEQFWEIQPEPFSLKSRADLRCIFCGGKMEVSHGVYFEFELGLYGKPEKKSHALDTWTRCNICGYTDVHGVAIDEDKYKGIAKMVHKTDQVDHELNPIERDSDDDIEEGMTGVIFSFDKKESNMKPGKPAWDGYENVVGLIPKFDMTCKMCSKWIQKKQKGGEFTDVKLIDGEVPLILRHSRMHKILSLE